MKDIKNKYRQKHIILRIILAVTGISLLAAGISFMRYAVFGVDPMSCLNIGAANKLGITFGMWQLIICFIMLAGVVVFDKSKIGFGTVYIMIAAGFTSDGFLWLINQFQFMEAFLIETRIAAFAAGLFFYHFGAAVYIETNMGLSPYDAVGIIISEKIKRENWFKWIRIGTDALCVFGGVLLNSDAGIGTLIAVLLGGPLISLFRKLLLKLNMFKLIQNQQHRSSG